jgi:hypothetical protein
MTPREFCDKVLAVPVTELGAEAVFENREEVILQLQYQLFEQSLDGNGNPLRSPYSDYANTFNQDSYRQRKLKIRGKEITDLFLSGDMFQAMALEVSSTEYIITSNVEYVDKLAEWANAPIFQLTTESQEVVRLHFLNAAMARKFQQWIA